MDLKQMRKISFIWGFFLVSLVVILTVFCVIYKYKSNDYKKLEENLVEASKKYVDAKFLYPEGSNQLRVSFSEMKEYGVITDLKKEDQECDGYVIVSHNGTVFDYDGYVKCPNYETKGYLNYR